VGVGDGSGVGLGNWADRREATSESVNTAKRQVNVAKTMVKNTCAAVNTAIAIASHLIHRGLSMRKNIDDEPHAAKNQKTSTG